MNTRTIVIIPTYNEAENISRIIDLIVLKNNNINVLVVDDNSPDGTSSLVNRKERAFQIEFF